MPARSGSRRRCTSSSAWSTAWPTSCDMDPAELRMKNLLRPEQFPYLSPTGWEYDSGEYPRALQMAMDIAGYQDLRGRAGRETGPRRADGHRGQLLHRDGRRRPAQAHGHSRAGHGRRCRGARPPDRQGGRAPVGAESGPGARDHVRPDRLGGDRASRPTTSRWCTETPTTPRSGSGRTEAGRRRCRARRWP